MPLVLSPLTLMSSPPLFVRLPLLCLPLLCWLLSPPLALRPLSFGSSFLRSLYCLYSFFSPFSGVSAGCGWLSALGSAPVVAPAPPGFPPFLIPLLFCLRLLLRFLLLLYLLPGLRVSRCFSLAFGSLSIACLFRACLGLISGGSGIPRLLYSPPTSLLHPFSCLCLQCCPLHQLSLCFALLRRAPLRVPLALPLLPRSPLWPWWLRSSAWSFFCFPPLSGAFAAPSVLLSQCLVTVLLSLCSWFVGPDAPGAAAPVPETLVPHL